MYGALQITKMKILITNDDGIDSHITRALHEKLSEKHDCTLIAPAKDKSGQGAAITLRTSVEVTKLDEQIYSVDGTPADCVKITCDFILKDRQVDLCISGIKHGSNNRFNIQ